LETITSRATAYGIDVLRQQAEVIAVAEDMLEQGPRLVASADCDQRIDVPERADREGGRRHAEIVRCGVAQEMIAAPQDPLDRVDRAEEAGITGRDESDLLHQEQAGIDVIAAESGNEAVLGRAPGAFEDGRAQAVGDLPPIGRAIGKVERARDLGQTIAGCPAHDRRKRVDFSPAAKLPRTGVGLESRQSGAFAQGFQAVEERRVARAGQPPIEEHLRHGEDDAAVGVVLDLLLGEIADAHRPHAAVSGQTIDDPLGQRLARHDAINRLETPVGFAGRHIGDVVDVVFHRQGGAQSIECMHDKVGVAQPAVAVIPCTSAVRRFRDRGRECGDDAAGLLETAQLERDGGADHRVLPFERYRQVAHPFVPVVLGPLTEFARRVGDAGGEPFVRPEDQVYRSGEDECAFLRNIGNRRVGGEPQRGQRRQEAHMVAAEGASRLDRAVIESRPYSDADARRPRQRLDPTQQHRRPKDATELPEARRQIGDPHRGACRIGKGRRQDGRIALVTLGRSAQALEADVEETRAILPGRVVEQTAEHGIAVEARPA
jgi:hypothetical protein